MGDSAAQPQKTASAQDNLTGQTVNRFVIEERLGAGGMGEVYRAQDPVLKRTVAIKRMAAELRRDLYFRQRFLKEAERASKLSDPHIAGIYDIIEAEGEVFLVMEYVEGSTLRYRLGSPMRLREFLPIAQQCADALAAAHSKGIAHCDIKPENIILSSSGRVKILDFGVARVLPGPDSTQSSDGSTEAVTYERPGGTYQYMAPETLLERRADARSDLFALGIVFHEALTGKHPFRGETGIATCNNIIHAEPAPPATSNPEVTPALSHILEKLLAKIPEERYATAADLAVDLRAVQRDSTVPRSAWPEFRPARRKRAWLWAAAGVALLAVLGALSAQNGWWPLHWAATPVAPAERLIAVLPVNLTSEDEQTQALAAGLAESLSTGMMRLTRREKFQVIPAAVLRENGVRSIEQARKELGVTLVIDWSLQRSGDQVRVTYSLVDARTKRQLDGDSVTLAAADSFAVADLVTEGVLRMLQLKLTEQERSDFRRPGTQVAGAYEYFLQGRGYLQNFDRPENLESAARVFGEALRLDERYALAHAGLGETYWRKYEATKDKSWVEQARRSCEKAREFAPESPASYICLGTIANGTGAYDEAASSFRQSIQLDPLNDDAYRGLGRALERLNRPEAAEETYRKAIEVRPQYWGGYNRLGSFYFRRGRYAEAAQMFQQVVALAPDSFSGYSNLGGAYLALGRYADAIEQLGRSEALRPTAFAYSNQATAYFALRRFDEAAEKYEAAVRLEGGEYKLWGNLGDARYWSEKSRAAAEEAYRRAIELAREELKVNPKDGGALSYLAVYHSMLREKSAALKAVQQAVALAPKDPEVLLNAALASQQLGDSAAALRWLEKGFANQLSTASVRDHPAFDSLHSHPALAEKLRAAAKP